jgi:hypothetical protein
MLVDRLITVSTAAVGIAVAVAVVDSCNTPYHSDCDSPKSTITTATAVTTAASSLHSCDDDCYSIGFSSTSNRVSVISDMSSETTLTCGAWGSSDEPLADELIKDIFWRQVSQSFLNL